MEKRYVVGVDVGTSTVKAVFVDGMENKIATTQLTEIFPVKTEKKDFLEYDATDWKNCVRDVLRKGFETGIDPEAVAGICFDDPRRDGIPRRRGWNAPLQRRSLQRYAPSGDHGAAGGTGGRAMCRAQRKLYQHV